MKLLLLIVAFCLPVAAAVRMDAVDDYLHVPQNTSFDSVTSTVSLYVRLSKESGGSGPIIGKGFVAGGGNVINYAITYGAADTFDFYFTSPNSTLHAWRSAVITGMAANTNNPFSVVATYQFGNSNSMRLYYNGINTTGTWIAAASNAVGVTNVNPFRFGTVSVSDGATRQTCYEAAIWTNILTHHEVLNIHHGPAGTFRQVRPKWLLGGWLLDEFPSFTTASGTNTFRDVSGWNNHATPLGSPVTRPSIRGRP